MLSQLNLRFHKKLIEALKVRAGRENTSVNALAERFPFTDTGMARHFLPAFPFSFPVSSQSAFAVKDTGLDRSPCKGTADACFPPPFALLPVGQSLALRPRSAPLQASL